MTKQYKHIDKLIKWLWYLLAASILFSAVIISLIRFALTEVESYRERVEELVSGAIKHQVYIESLDARLVGLMPTLVLEGVRVLDAKGQKEILRVNKANVGVSLYQSIKHQKLIPSDILISGTKLALIRLTNGQITLRGFDLSTVSSKEVKGNKELTSWFFTQSSLALKESTVIWKDYKRQQKSIILKDINLEINNRGKTHVLHGFFSPGSLGKNVELAMDISGDLRVPSQWQGDFFVQGDEIYLAEWGQRIQHEKIELTDGIADFQLWGSLNENGFNKIYGDVSAYQLNIKHTEKKQLKVGLLGGLFEFAKKDQEWYLNVDRFQYTGTGGILPETNFSIISKNIPGKDRSSYDIRVGKLDLKAASEILVNSGLITGDHESMIRGLAPSGKINALRVASSVDNNNQNKLLVHGQLRNIYTKQYKKIPGVSNISGDLWLDHNHGKLELFTEAGSIDFGKLFRAPIKLEKVNGVVNWWKYQDGWQVTSTELQAENNEVTTLNNLSLYFPANGPTYMDLYSSFAGSAQYKSNYLPVAIMKKPLINWLDQSIVSGVISHGGLVYRGRFADFPFRKPRGQFLVQLYTNNLELSYQKGWPVIRDADFDASFDSKSIEVDLHLARLFTSAVTDTKVRINDYRNPIVDVTGKVTGNMADVVSFVVNSPLKISKELLDVRYEGRAKTDVDLHIPLRKGQSIGYTGNVSIDKGNIQLIGDSVSLANIKGNVAFSNTGFASKNLTADIFDRTSALNIYSQQTSTGNKTYLATSGQTDIQKLLKSFSIPAYKHSSGNLNWQALVDFSDDREKVPVLVVHSDMSGVSLDMPYPLKKNASEEKNMSLKAFFKGKGNTDLYIEYADAVSLSTRLVKNKTALHIERGHVHFAGGEAVLPKRKRLYVSGSLDQFYPSRWVKHINQYSDTGNHKNFSLPVQLDMNRLSIGIDVEKEKKDVAIKPRDFPVIKGVIKDLKFDGMPLGKLSIDMIHHKGDMQLNRLNIHSPDMEFNSSGRWEYSNRKHSSRMNVSLKSDDYTWVNCLNDSVCQRSLIMVNRI
ncbi:MAG: DUF3971 domain-containing protein [Gammaproteobacteria bacterium]